MVAVDGSTSPRGVKGKLVKHATLDAFTKLGVDLVTLHDRQLVDRVKHLVNVHCGFTADLMMKVAGDQMLETKC